jgi:DNA-binding NarL/FixJ family response regulator
LRISQESHLDLPFLVVSGAIGEEIAAGAVAAGAHDYIMKRTSRGSCPRCSASCARPACVATVAPLGG